MFVTLSVLLSIAYLVPGIPKLAGHPKMRASADHFGIPWSRYRLIGVAEVLAAAGILVGLVWLPAGIAAAVGMILLLVGAVVAHQRSGDPRREMTLALVELVLTLAYLAVAFSR